MEEFSVVDDMLVPNDDEQPPAYNYDSLFPALPESMTGAVLNASTSKMQVGSSVVTQVFRVPSEERKQDTDKFGERESMRICQNIMKDTGAHIEISNGKDQSLTFLVTGRPQEVQDARRKILVHFQTQFSRQVNIPKEHHGMILGKKGDRLREIEKTTATKINVPNINEESDVITICGSKEGVEKAEHEIRTMSDEQSKKAREYLNIPKVYHPFINGPFNANINRIMAETGARVTVPPSSVMRNDIIVTGEKDAVFAAKTFIEEIYHETEKKCTTVSVEVKKAKHKYVFGQKGSIIQEILAQTGVSVEIPPLDMATDTITLRGPQENLGDALNAVYKKANSIQNDVLAAPTWLHKFIIGRKGANIKELNAEYPNANVDFSDNEIKIEGPPEQVAKAREQLAQIVKDYSEKLTFCELFVDPTYFKYIIGKAGANINRLKEETNVIINIDEKDGPKLIRIEGPIEGCARARKELEEQIEKLSNEKEILVHIDHNLFPSLIGTKGENIREVRNKFKDVVILVPGPKEKKDEVKLRGPRDEVDKCHEHLMKIVGGIQESSFVLKIPIFKQSHKYIIGKGGANIKKIREETQTKIDLPAEGDTNEVIVITGKEENVRDACDRIQKIQNELTDVVSEEIIIPPQYYNSIIGTGGKLISAIMEECGGVSIKFPSAESKSDKVTIRGPKEDVEKVKVQLLELSNERQLSSFSAEVRAKAQHHKFLIGKNGASIRKIRDNTGCRIIFPTSTDEDRETITIIGKQEGVEAAKAQLEMTIKEIDNTTEDEISVDQKYHLHFVAKRGDVLRRITEDYGGVMISFPRPGSDSDRVSLKGAKECIAGAKQRILEIISDLEAQVTIECVISQRHHRTVMGARGNKVQTITAEFDVLIKFPDRAATEPVPNVNGGVGGDGVSSVDEEIESEPIRHCDIIRISGRADKCEAAKQALIALVPVTEEINVPFDLHRMIIGKRGSDVRQLMSKYDVHIDLSPPEEKLDIIKITGAVDNVSEAKKAIAERVAEFEADRAERELRSFELRIEVDPKFHQHIIGRKGAIITNIRLAHNVQISFPKKEDREDNVIIIQGYEAATHGARDDIMKIVNDYDSFITIDLEIDERIHPRLIGQRGRNIRKVIDDYNVDIKFPRPGAANPKLVTITGSDDNVQNAKDIILNMEEEFMQDLDDQPAVPSYTPFSKAIETAFAGSNPFNAATTPEGFVVQGGPWEQRQDAPDTGSHKDFPVMGPVVPEAQLSSAWGPRR